ncbi:MAG: chitobiase/beta-hexosaminidase C-terminal domain-containing protein [Bacteroidota bacterium]
MRSIVAIMLILVLPACKNIHKEHTVYVQHGDIQLANPRLETTNVIIDSIVKITATLPLEDVKIHYTKDGSEPTEASLTYEDTISVSEPGTYHFKAFHPHFRASDKETLSFYKKGITVDTIAFLSPLNMQYPGEGEKTPVNHKKGTSNFRDGQWIGVTEPLEAILTFKNNVFIASVDIGYLVNTSAWIFPIQDMAMAISQDGINFTDLNISVTFEEPETHVSKQENIRIPISKEVKKIKIKIWNTPSIPEWHDGKNTPAWLFTDEWIFNAKNN